MNIHSLLTIHNIRSGIWWAITKVILNYSMLPTSDNDCTWIDLLGWQEQTKFITFVSFLLSFSPVTANFAAKKTWQWLYFALASLCAITQIQVLLLMLASQSCTHCRCHSHSDCSSLSFAGSQEEILVTSSLSLTLSWAKCPWQCHWLFLPCPPCVTQHKQDHCY